MWLAQIITRAALAIARTNGMAGSRYSPQFISLFSVKSLNVLAARHSDTEAGFGQAEVCVLNIPIGHVRRWREPRGSPFWERRAGKMGNRPRLTPYEVVWYSGLGGVWRGTNL